MEVIQKRGASGRLRNAFIEVYELSVAVPVMGFVGAQYKSLSFSNLKLVKSLAKHSRI